MSARLVGKTRSLVYFRQKKPRQLAGLRYERVALENVCTSGPPSPEGSLDYSRMVRMSASRLPRRWVKRAAAAPLITR